LRQVQYIEQIVFALNDAVNRFYMDYMMLKETLSRSIIIAPVENLELVQEEHATLLLNRLIFMFFLQARRGAQPSIIPENFLQTLVQQSGIHSYTMLKKVWFEHLALDRPPSEIEVQFNEIPFLNCGLFSPHEDLEINSDGRLRDVDVDGDVLGNVLAMLEQYSWTLDETECEKTSSCITPSILGHIYEKACNQKESGSYYTPDYITDYIIRKSISIFLTKHLNDAFSTSYKDAFHDLLEQEVLDGNEMEHVAWLYFAIIRKLTVCDDACGSGAFLVAAARILVEIHQDCIVHVPRDHPGFQRRVNSPEGFETIDVMKRHVITCNIFGVDIQPGSIEVAKLRLWLYLLSTFDMQCGNGLPDLDSNLRVGNSLLGFINISDAWKNKLSLHGDFVQLQYDRLLKCRQAVQTSPGSITCKQALESVMLSLREELDQAFLASTGVSSLKNIRDLQLFHWCIEFPEIVNHSGFDVMVGNPPYLSFSSSKAKKEIIGKDITRKLYKDVDDIYEAFIKRTRDLCNGVSGMIIPYNFYKQLGPRMVPNLIDYDNLGEGIFIGVSIAVSILFFDQQQHDGFNFRNYVFQENKRDLLGNITSTRITSFDLYADDPVIKHIELVARSHESYGLDVTRGEELGKKALQSSRDPGFIPIYTANELVPFHLEDAAYFIDPQHLKKNFYDTQKIGVNLAFRHRIKAAFISNMVTIKSIICIYKAPLPVLLEVLGTWNSKLFDWYQCKKFSNFQEIRLNTIDDIKTHYPLLLINRPEFQDIVKYLVMSYSEYLHELVDFIIYEMFFNDILVSDGIYPDPGFHLLETLGKNLHPVDFDGWSTLHWKRMAGDTLAKEEESKFASIEAKNKRAMETAIRAMQADADVHHWMETMRSHPWIERIEEETEK